MNLENTMLVKKSQSQDHTSIYTKCPEEANAHTESTSPGLSGRTQTEGSWVRMAFGGTEMLKTGLW